MKFRAKMSELVSIRLFAHILSTLQKHSKIFVFRLLPDKLVIIISEKYSSTSNPSGVGGSSAWCEIPADAYFTEYKMEGITAEDNEIYLEIAADVLASSISSLKSSHNVLSLKLKLTKKLTACLTLEIESQSTNSTVTCTHDIRVNVIPRKHWADFQRPIPPTFDISFAMPELKPLRLTIERMKSIAPKLVFKMTKKGILSLSANTYNVQCTVTFPELRVYELEGVDSEDRPTQEVNAPEDDFGIEVDMKSILHLIPPEGAKPSSMICSMAEGRLLHWLISFGEIQVEYYVPGSSTLR